MRTARDLTQGPIARTLLVFALPTLGANILQSLNASINMVWIGRFLGEDALAATSNATNIVFLSLGTVFGFGMAATILVGQHIGRRDIDGARRAIGGAAGLFLGMSLIVTVAGYMLTPPLLRLLATPPEALPLATNYLQMMMLSMPASFILTLLMMGLRGSGDSMTPLWFMLLAVLLDAGLNPFLIAGIGPFPKLGIAGSAVATLIANYVTTVALLATIYARDLPIRLRGGELRYLFPRPALLWLLLSKGFLMSLQMAVMSFSGIAMVGLVNREGVIVTAAYGVALQLWTYISMPAIAMGAAVSAMAAQNIGAGRWDRVGSITKQGIIYNVIITGSMVILLTIFDRTALGLFLGSHSPALPISAHIQHVSGWAFVVSGIMMVLFGTVRANGAVVGPLIVMLITFLPCRVGFAVFAYDYLGQDALWLAFPFGAICGTTMAAAYYRWANWRKGSLADVAEQAEHVEAPPAVA